MDSLPPSQSSSTSTLCSDDKKLESNSQAEQTSERSYADYYVPNYPTDTPWAYYAVISLFRFVLAIFFSRIVIENVDRIPNNGRPTIVLVNHSNSLTDALIIMASIPRHTRRMLRMTAKATHFRRGTFSSWLIEKAGSVPLQRAHDYHSNTPINNQLARELLIQALGEQGDAICMFPEGISRYHPELAPFKTGALRIASEVLKQYQSTPNFELNILTCSITYLHRQNFRSDVLVSFHEPIKLKPLKNLELISEDEIIRRRSINDLTIILREQLRLGTLDSPTWELIKVGNISRTIYAPFGTKIGLGLHIRLTQKFIDGFAQRSQQQQANQTLISSSSSLNNNNNNNNNQQQEEEEEQNLIKELLNYQTELYKLGIKDQRILNLKLIKRRELIKRIILRCLMILSLFLICLPGLVLWFPTFFITKYFAHQQKLKGPAWDTYDEVTQTKLLWGLASGLITYFSCVIITLPIFPITIIGIPVLMWFSLRWFEDLVSALRATRALTKMLMIGQKQINELRIKRSELLKKIQEIILPKIGLPNDSSKLLINQNDDENNNNNNNNNNVNNGNGNDDNDNDGCSRNKEIIIKNGKVSKLGYFSLRRRRKKDYNEVLRLWDVIDM